MIKLFLQLINHYHMNKLILPFITLSLVLLTTGCSKSDDDKPTKPTTKTITVLDRFIIKEVQKNLKTGYQAYRSKSDISLYYDTNGKLTTYNDKHEFLSTTGYYIQKNHIIEYKYDEKQQLTEINDYPNGKDDYYKIHHIHYNTKGLIEEVVLGSVSYYKFEYNQNNHLKTNNRYTSQSNYTTDNNGNIIKITNNTSEQQVLTYDTNNSPYTNLPFNNTFDTEELPFAYNERNNLLTNTKNNRKITYKYNSDKYPTTSTEILNYSDDQFEESIIIDYYYTKITVQSK